MGDKVSLDRLAHGLKTLNRSHPSCPEETIERYLDHELRETPLRERVALLEELIGRFPDDVSLPQQGVTLAQDETARILSLLSGTRLNLSEQTPDEVSEKFAASLNTLFDTLNQIISVINSKLLGAEPELETIRHVIGSQIEGMGEETSLKAHLDQIQQAFLISHRAFQDASMSVVEEMLAALDPEILAGSTKSIINFGPMRKAEIFDAYREKYLECRKWFDSGRFSEKLLREFEKICQQRYKGK
jgi:hypothetical protein